MRATTGKNRALWVVQGLLAALFLFAGTSKFIMPPEAMAGPVDIPLAFIRFIGVAEICGALGLILPGIFHIKRYLTPAAATGLVLVMSGAVTVTIEGGMVGAAIVPLIVGTLAATVAYGRSAWLESETAQAPQIVRHLKAA